MNTERARDWAESMLEFIYPPICLGCGQPRESKAILCGQCHKAISYLEHPLCINCTRPIITGADCPDCRPGMLLLALGDHIGPLQQAVIGLKFRHVRRVAQWAGSELIARQRDRILALSPSALVPVPLHSGREYFRGFNQAELLSECLADNLDIDIRCDLVIRTKHRRVQSRLSGDKRFKNVRGVFEALPTDESVGGIMIVDDVVTSGATISEVARVLREAGHRVVGAVAIAHRG